MDARTFEVAGYEVALYGPADATTLVVAIADHGEAPALWDACDAQGAGDIALAAVSGVDWNRDLSPWPAPAVFKRGEPFAGEAEAFLGRLIDEVLPEVTARLLVPLRQTVIAGYSLAGLFAVYAAYSCDAFDAVVSASGSLWYPDFMAFAQEHEVSQRVRKAYFSVGDREAATKNKTMQAVEKNTRAACELLANRGVRSMFELNEGGHFQDSEKRLARGIAWAVAR